jgi:hypothetical protein
VIATHQFEALNNHSIQDIETWDDPGEDVAGAIAAKILDQQSIVAVSIGSFERGARDDPRLLSGPLRVYPGRC